MPDPVHPEKPQLHLVSDYHLLNKSINSAYNGNKIISCYPLLNITDLLVRLQNCKIFSSLDLRSGYHHISLTLEAKPKTLGCSPVQNLFSNRCILLPNVTDIIGFEFCFTYLDNIVIYGSSWEEHLQHWKTVFSHPKAANLKRKLSKYQFFKHNLCY